MKELSDFYTPEDIVRKKRNSELESTSRRLDVEIAAADQAQKNGDNRDHEKYIDDLIEGKDTAPPKTSVTQLYELRRQKLGIETALDVLARQDYLAQVEAKKRYCRDLKDKSDMMAKQLAESMVATNKIHLEYFKIKRNLINEGIGLHGGVFSVDVERFLGIPWDRAGALADYFRDSVKAGHIKSVPEALH